MLDLPDGTRLGVVISWEVFFAGRAREGVKLGAEAIVNPTNGASYTGTIVQTQQVASSRLRAIETGRWVVQAAPTGFTAVVDSDGNVLQRTAVSERNVLYDTVELREGLHLVHQPRRRLFIVALLALVGTALWFSRRRTVPLAPTQRQLRRSASLFSLTLKAQSTSSMSVTGPSLTSSTRMSVRNRPVSTSAPSARSAVDDPIDERFGRARVGRRRSSSGGGPWRCRRRA